MRDKLNKILMTLVLLLAAATPAFASTANLNALSAALLSNGVVPVANGGTSATTASGARTNLGLVIGTNVEAYSSVLDTYASIAPSANVQTLLGASNYAGFKITLSLNNVENTALSTWAGSTNITTLGTIATGTVPAANVSGLAASATTNTTNASNISSGTLGASRLPAPSATTLGGVESIASASHNFLTSISTAGAPTQAQPAFTDISGSTTLAQLPSIANNTVLANVSGSSAVPAADTITSILDSIGSTQGDVLYRGASTWSVLAPGSSGQLLSSGGASANPSWVTASGTGTVTSVSVASANGFAGSVATSTTTPAITISTSITGIAKGNGTALSAATNGTDYISPGTTATLTVGYPYTSTSSGTKSSGTFTPSFATNNMQWITNGGAFTLGVPTGEGSMALDVINNGSAGTITTSGYTKVNGDTLDTTNAHKFRLFISVINGNSLLNVNAMQ